MSEVNKFSDYNISDFLNNQKMSAAVMSSTVYDFGDLLYKHHQQQNTSNNNSNNNARQQQQQQQNNNINLQSHHNSHHHHHQKVLRWGADSTQRAVGSPSSTPTQQQQHATLSRRNSTPAPTPAQISSLVHSVQNIILDNIREQQQQQQPQLHRKLDRSQSEPCPSALLAAANAKAANINTSRYKTELCRPFEESGSCKYGDKCQFAHGGHELRNLVRHPKYKTELCRTFHTIGFCPYGPRCHFIHNAEEARTKCPLMQGAGSRNPPDLRPLYLGGSSAAESPSPASSLSQSPTNSVGSFFSSETDLVFPPAGSPPPVAAAANTAFGFRPLVLRRSPPPTPRSPPSPASPPPPASPEARLPVFNKLHMFPGLQAGN